MSQAGDIFRKLLKPRILWLLFFAGVLFLFVFILIMSFQDLPSFEELENPKSDLATQLYTHDGAVLGRLFV
jgi:penicillin-binding protein 1A